MTVGDQLFGADGRPRRVVATSAVMAGRPCWAVEFSGCTVIVAADDHQWLTDTVASRRSAYAATYDATRYKHQHTFAAV